MEQEPKEQFPGEEQFLGGDGDQELLDQSSPSEEALESLDVETLQARLEEAERERAQFKNLAQRAQADLINYKRRVEEEHQELVRNANVGLIVQLLQVVDDFQRALEHIPASAEEEKWLEGVTLIQRKLMAVLEAEGVNRIETQGRQFDPREHEALFYEEVESEPEGTVLRVIRDGYKLGQRVLRPAQVSVAKPKEDTQPEASSSMTLENDSPSGEKEA